MHRPISSYLPSRQFGIIVLFLIIVGSFYAYTHLTKTPNGNTPLSTQMLSYIPEGYDPYADNDGDGLANWEEAMWGTNPNAMDTDGDGTTDNVELALNRNPLVNATDDSLSTYPAIPSLESADTGYAGRTAGIAQSFASQLYAIGVSGNDTSVNGSDVLNNIIKTELAQGKLVDEYVTKDVLSVDDSMESYRAYGNAFGKFINTYKERNEPYATAEIIKRAFTTEDLPSLSALSSYAAFLQAEARVLATTPVPISFVAEHIELVNGVHNMGKAFTILTQSAQDPFMALLGLGEYSTAYKRFTETIDTFTSASAKQNTSFLPEEPGFMFIQE